jgi:DNA-binding response OmpR family regulator
VNKIKGLHSVFPCLFIINNDLLKFNSSLHSRVQKHEMIDTTQRILVIEDDPDIGKMLEMILKYQGYAVTLMEHPGPVDEIVSQNSPDLIVMDMLLSGVNGVELCSFLKKDKQSSHVPIVMISAHPNAMELCMNAGADDFVAKPFEVDILLNKIKTLVPKR